MTGYANCRKAVKTTSVFTVGLARNIELMVISGHTGLTIYIPMWFYHPSNEGVA